MTSLRNVMHFEARLLKLGRVLAVGDAMIHSAGQAAPVARASMTYSIPPKWWGILIPNLQGIENIKFYLPFDNFKTKSEINNIEEYLVYKNGVMNFVEARNKRIALHSWTNITMPKVSRESSSMNNAAQNYFDEGCGRCAFHATPQCKVNTWKKELALLRKIARIRIQIVFPLEIVPILKMWNFI